MRNNSSHHGVVSMINNCCRRRPFVLTFNGSFMYARTFFLFCWSAVTTSFLVTQLGFELKRYA